MPGEALPHYPGKELESMSLAVNYHRWIIDEFEPYLRGEVAEVGAGIGSMSHLILASPVRRLHAYEPSGNMFPVLAEGLRGDSRAVAVNDFFGAKHAAQGFDSILYINVLEHVDDDRAELANAWQALKPGGHLLVFVPALQWLFSNFDTQVGHLRRYGRAALKAEAQAAGFAIVKARYFDMAGVLPWYINFVLLRRPMGSGSVSLYDKVVVPASRFLESLLPPPIGKNILLVARKP
jgi:2-polyprenyl-3-methyl-5-hydroxy-6-metoxy-1,4-benzoquinol methylase